MPRVVCANPDMCLLHVMQAHLKEIDAMKKQEAASQVRTLVV